MNPRNALSLLAVSLGGLLLSASLSPLWGAPTLTVGTISGQAGTVVNLPITFDPTTASVAGLQFNLTLPAGISTGTVTAGGILYTKGENEKTKMWGDSLDFVFFVPKQTNIARGSLF